MTTLTALPGGRQETLVQAVARRLRVILAEHQIKQIEIALAIGMSKAAFSKRVRGEQALGLEDIDAIAAVLGISPEHLLTDNVATPPTPDGGDESLLSGSNRRPSAYKVAPVASIVPFPSRRDDDGRIAA